MIVRYVIRRKKCRRYHSDSIGLCEKIEDAHMVSSLLDIIGIFNAGHLNPDMDEICTVVIQCHPCLDIDYSSGQSKLK